jgi:hypothetical protein
MMDLNVKSRLEFFERSKYQISSSLVPIDCPFLLPQFEPKFEPYCFVPHRENGFEMKSGKRLKIHGFAPSEHSEIVKLVCDRE